MAYVNAWPLTHGLDRDSRVDLTCARPSEIANGLMESRFDAGLVPVAALLAQPALEVIPGCAIGAFGRVDSVVLTLRTSPHLIRRLALDPASRTSQLLAQVVLAERFGVRPEVEECPPDRASRDSRFDASLVIGDDALREVVAGVPHLDLAECWSELHGLPFVFAVWAARPGVLAEFPDLVPALLEARDLGQGARAELAHRAAREVGLSAEIWRVYLERRIRYGLGLLEQQGLRRFLDLAASRLTR